MSGWAKVENLSPLAISANIAFKKGGGSVRFQLPFKLFNVVSCSPTKLHFFPHCRAIPVEGMLGRESSAELPGYHAVLKAQGDQHRFCGNTVFASKDVIIFRMPGPAMKAGYYFDFPCHKSYKRSNMCFAVDLFLLLETDHFSTEQGCGPVS